MTVSQSRRRRRACARRRSGRRRPAAAGAGPGGIVNVPKHCRRSMIIGMTRRFKGILKTLLACNLNLLTVTISESPAEQNAYSA